MSTSARPSILATLAYHDILNYPLTAWEVFQFSLQTENAKYEIRDTKYADALDELRRLKEEGRIGEKTGFYFLKGREALCEERIERTKISEEKWHRVRRALSFLRAAPFVRAVALSGSIAMGNAAAASDIDLFVIAERGRIWTARFFLTALAVLTRRLRPGRITRFFFPFVRSAADGTFADKLCLNHYVTTGSLAIRNPSIFNAATYVHLAPLWGGGVFERFFEKNRWISGFFPHAVLSAANRRTFAPLGRLGWLREILERLFGGRAGDFLERALAFFQQLFIARNPLTGRGGRVVADDEELAFHPETPEKAVLDSFTQKVLELLED